MKKEIEEFRINEYADYFTISKKHEIYIFETIFHALFGMPKKYISWKTVNKEGESLDIANYKTEHTFETKEECLKWIEDYKKYPIYHFVNQK